ncbi:MAG: histidinol dehydrogenase [Bacteroidia bacterium]|nr:MAG: histidinol dehydrogenase [Bacteroidia bacterium]
MRWQVYKWAPGFSPALLRGAQPSLPDVSEVFSLVESQGDEALYALTEKWDGVKLGSLQVPAEGIRHAQVEASLARAMEQAYANLYAFHLRQKPKEIVVETQPGVLCGLRYVPLERVGLYVPGGTAPLFSTVLMLGVPAQISGVPSVVLVTPPGPQGKVHPAVLYAARLCGIETVYTVGGAQAIAALAVGTPSIPRVDKIFGPGNRYVQAAKLEAARRGVAIDMPAGPSEVVVIADETAPPRWVAADLLAQAEHGPDSLVGLLYTSAYPREAVEKEMESLLQGHPRRSFVEATLVHSWAVEVPDLPTALAVANEVAPEHLILACAEPERWLTYVRRAGSVFLGIHTPESAGDYASGTNHVLPTGGTARSYGGLTVLSFLRSFTYQQLRPEGVRTLGPLVEALAEAEGLPSHAEAMRLRRTEASPS